MQRRLPVWLSCVAILLGGHGMAAGADPPVAGRKLVLKQGAAGDKLVVVLRDPGLAVPVAGAPDDPAQNTGMVVQVIARSRPSEPHVLFVPTGFGTPGWSARPHGAGRYVYRNPEAPAGPSAVSRVRFDGKGLKLVARTVPPALAQGPLGAVAVVIAMGDTRVCAAFDGDAVRRDETGAFIGGRAVAPSVADCLDVDGLLALPCGTSQTCGGVCPGDAVCGGNPFFDGCRCVAPDQPCGDTAPVCNGECPAGEECVNVGGVPAPSCACLPAGSVGCGTVDPVCSAGDCPDGLTCQVVTFQCCGGVSISACGCGLDDPPPPLCGGVRCPDSWTCWIAPGQEFCLPPFCVGGAGAPVCDGTCPGPTECAALSGTCFCLEFCEDASGFPTCGGACSDPTTICQADSISGRCVCGPSP